MSLKMRCHWSIILRTKKKTNQNTHLISSYTSINNLFFNMTEQITRALSICFSIYDTRLQLFHKNIARTKQQRFFQCFYKHSLFHLLLRLCVASQLSPTPLAFPILPTYKSNTSDNYRPSLNSPAKQPLSYHVVVSKNNFKTKTLMII